MNAGGFEFFRPWITVKFGQTGSPEEAEFRVNPEWDMEQEGVDLRNFQWRLVRRPAVGKLRTPMAVGAKTFTEGHLKMFRLIMNLYWQHRDLSDEDRSKKSSAVYQKVMESFPLDRVFG